MDIGSLSTGMNQASLSLAVSTALTKKIIDTANENAQSLLKIMNANYDPNLGNNIDVRV